MKKNKDLTWDELASLYDKANSGRKARTLPMDKVFEWAAAKTKKFRVTEDGSIQLIKKSKNENSKVKTKK